MEDLRLTGPVRRVLREVDAARSRVEAGDGFPDIGRTQLPEPPSMIGDAWRSGATSWGLCFPRRALEACTGNTPRETGTPTDFANRFPWWSDDMRAALLGEKNPIVLNGPPRSGKTTTAAWLALRHEVWSAWDISTDPPVRRIERYSQVYARAWDLLERLKSRFQSKDGGESLAHHVRRAGFVVIDDMDEATTSWEVKTLGSIILDRVENGLPTVIALDQEASDFDKNWPPALLGGLTRTGRIFNLHPRLAPTLSQRTPLTTELERF